MRPLNDLAAALALFQAEVPVIAKKQTARVETRSGPSYSYTYADLAAIAPVVLPLLAKHGLAFITMPTAGGPVSGPVLVGMLVHTSGQYVKGALPIVGRTPQEIGSSLTYGRRYLLGCLTGVVTDDDDDGRQATPKAQKRAAKAAPDEGPPVAPPVVQRRPRGPAPVADQANPPERPSDPPGAGPGPDLMTDAQRRAMFAAIGKALGPDAGRDERLAFCAQAVGHPLASSSELTAPEVSKVLTALDDQNAGRALWVWDPDGGGPGVGLGAITRPASPDDEPPPDDEIPWG